MAKMIGTHSGHFHCDEALAVGLLRRTAEFKDAGLVRSRDPEVLKTCDVVVDVGGVYDPATHRYDHHQRGFADTFDDKHATKLSSAGLVYKHFGREVVGALVSDSAAVELIYQKLYNSFIEALDANDNGIACYEGTPKYDEGGTSLPARVGRLNPGWNQEGVDELAQFEKAVALTTSEFLERVDIYANSWLPARAIVEKAVADRHTVHPSGQIVLFEQSCPWKNHLDDIETEQGLGDAIKYCVSESNDSWRVLAVPVRPGSFESRKALPEAWRGLRDADLSKETGIDGGVFVHMSGFIGGNATREGALAMAAKALEL